MSLTATPEAVTSAAFTGEQREYLDGFIAALARRPFVGQTAGGQLTADPAGASANLAAAPVEETVFGTPLSELAKPERWKYEENPLDIWDKLLAHAEADKFPDEADTFRFKFFGLFHVAPTQDSFMLRLRIPAGQLTGAQLRGLAALAEEHGGGYAHVTTRANLQIREFRPRSICAVLTGVQDLGLTSRGAGADNIRNITATPTSGFDREELIDVRPFAHGLHHYILNQRDLFGLPRKFNVAFDSGGSISAASATNDLCFAACRLSQAITASGPDGSSEPIPAGIYFRVQLGGITGHGDFARDSGWLIRPDQAVAVAAAMIRVFSENGDRTNRKKARLKYLLEKWGPEKFLAETAHKLAFVPLRVPIEKCDSRLPVSKHGWLGVHPQRQAGLSYVGIGLPAGRLSAAQMRGLASLAERYGRGELRLTVWQNLLIPHVPEASVPALRQELRVLDFNLEDSPAAGGIVACTGNRGCKYASTDTKAHAVTLAETLQDRLAGLSCPVNIHFTGCPHSCAQHYCGDIGLLGAKLADGTEGYHVVVGGGMDHEEGIARELFKSVRADDVPSLVEKILTRYQELADEGESFVHWARRHEVNRLKEVLT
ncbi:MAG TPA: NirA family protein [Candidatus Didemnitutus sp.]|nr:NirA family protein [Candidatus Didemnitutus sp.]